MDATPASTPAAPSGRDEVLATLLVVGAAAALGGLTYLAAKKLGERKAPPPPLPPHALFVDDTLKDIAQHVGMQPPTVLAHLRRLEAEGKVMRVDWHEGPRYAVLPSLHCEWIDPDHGMRDAWRTSQPVDWRFPLVTRVRDQRAQRFLVEWLDRAQARGLLPPFRSRHEPKADVPLLQAVVYGSCARGDAGPNSDLDVLVVGDLGKKTMTALVDLAHEVALRGDHRNPDVRTLDAKGWGQATAPFRTSIAREGKTVFTNDYDAPFLERPLEVRIA